MKFAKYIFVLFVFFGLKSTAQSIKLSNSLFWEISGNGLTKSSYLFGTYHFAGKNFLDSMTTVTAKLATSDVIIGELLLKDSLLPMKLLPFMQLKKDTSLDKILSENEYKLVAKYLKEVSGYDLKLLNGLNPMAIQIMLIQFTAPKTISEKNPPLDIYFQDVALFNNKKIIGLETVEEQGNIMFGANLNRQKEILLDNITNSEKYKKQGEDLYQYYIHQDLIKTSALFNEKNGYTTAEFDDLLKNRNLAWIKKLPAIMSSQSAFIAVGAGHLIDQWGLINLLRNAGYKVEPLKTN